MTSKDVDSESEFSTYDNLNFKHMTYIKTRPASSTYTWDPRDPEYDPYRTDQG